jgi:hypothetical protein
VEARVFKAKNVLCSLGMPLAAVLAAALVASSLAGLERGGALVAGGLTAWLSGLLLWWRKARPFSASADTELRLVYRTAVERMVLVAGLLALWMGVLALAPVYVLGGFILGQLALILSSITCGIE